MNKLQKVALASVIGATAILGFNQGANNNKPESFEEKCELVRKYDYNCSDFETQEEAQSFYDLSIECTGEDKFELDRDLDGLACELNGVIN